MVRHWVLSYRCNRPASNSSGEARISERLTEGILGCRTYTVPDIIIKSTYLLACQVSMSYVNLLQPCTAY